MLKHFLKEQMELAGSTKSDRRRETKKKFKHTINQILNDNLIKLVCFEAINLMNDLQSLSIQLYFLNLMIVFI